MRRRSRGRGIEIPEQVAASAAIPEDLDSNVHGPYAVPDPDRRRVAARVYLAAAAVTAAAIWLGLPSGMWLLVAVFLAIAAYSWLAGWHLVVREGPALETANRAIGFPVGHATASLGFGGWRARPIWNVLMFSADEPPTRRGLVRVDAIAGDVIETYAEEIPPDER